MSPSKARTGEKRTAAKSSVKRNSKVKTQNTFVDRHSTLPKTLLLNNHPPTGRAYLGIIIAKKGLKATGSVRIYVQAESNIKFAITIVACDFPFIGSCGDIG